MVRRSFEIAFVVAVVIASTPGVTGDDGRDAAELLGRFLRTERSQDLSSVLPEGGKVRLSLPSFGAEPGTYAPAQVEALLRSGLGRIDIGEFAVERDWHDGPYALVRARAVIRSRDTPARDVRFDLAFQREDGRWVLREFRESTP